jgi:hypothetical protein
MLNVVSMRAILSVTVCMTTGSVFAADSLKCNTSVTSTSIIESKITGTKDVERLVSPYIDGTRKCAMSMQVMIDEHWIPASGFKIFDADMSETTACGLATKRAKVSLLSKLGIETVVHNTDRNCVEKTSAVTKSNMMCMRVYKNAVSAGKSIRVWSKLCNENGKWVRK